MRKTSRHFDLSFFTPLTPHFLLQTSYNDIRHHSKMRHARQLRSFESIGAYNRIRLLEGSQKNLTLIVLNLTQQMKGLERLHTSMLKELLEDIEDIEIKVDNSVFDVRKEISQMELNHTKLLMEQSLIKQENVITNKNNQNIKLLEDEYKNAKRYKTKMQQFLTDNQNN